MGAGGWFRSAVFAAALALAPSVALADPPRPARATIGDITFHHRPHEWRLAAGGESLVATCLSIDCPGVVIDIDQRPSQGACTKQFVLDTARRLFPLADRHAVNTLSAGRFGLVLSASRRGPDFGVPTFVFACLDWQGRDYRFRVRPETVGDSSWTAGALHHLVARASAPPPRVEPLRIGAMSLEIATEIWDVDASGADGSAVLTCRPPTCRDDGPFLVVSARRDEGPGGAPEPDGEHRRSRDTRVEEFTGEGPGALTFDVATTHSPCRNYVPAEVSATVRHGDTIYRIATPALHGCRSSREVPRPVFEALLSGARIVATP